MNNCSNCDCEPLTMNPKEILKTFTLGALRGAILFYAVELAIILYQHYLK